MWQKNLPNFIAKDGWQANSPDLNPIENIWSIITRQRKKIQPQKDERAEKATTLCTEKCDSRHAKGTPTFYS